MAKENRMLKYAVVMMLTVLVLITSFPTISFAEETPARSGVVVSMGDSYSSGEGIEPYYGVNDPNYDDNDLISKIQFCDWVAHRSSKAWAGQLVLPEIGELSNSRYGDEDATDPHWYFVAASGAKTKDIYGKQNKTSTYENMVYSTDLDPQIGVLYKLKDQGIVPDYITLTLGGNDLGFEGIIKTAAVKNTYLYPFFLSDELKKATEKLDDEKDGLRKKLKDVYTDINNAVKVEENGVIKQPCIIVADYPGLLDPSGKGLPFSRLEAKWIDSSVDYFNLALCNLCNECRENDGMDIWFVDVAKEFYGHEAYSDDPWINGVVLLPQKEDIDQRVWKTPASAQSLHPNIDGATKGYRKCVQNFINWKESLDGTPTLTSTPTPTEEPFDFTYAAYREVLVSFHNELRKVEEGNRYFATDELKSCALTDLTGDGFPELVVLYWSDHEYYSKPDKFSYADISIYTIFTGDTSATEILHLSQVVNYDVFSVLTILDNGNLLFKKDNFSFTECSFIEYAFDGLTFQPVNSLEYKTTPADDDDIYYYYNDDEISKGDYETRISYFSDKVSDVFIKIPNDIYEDWTNAINNASEFSLTYDEAWDLITPAHNSEPILTQEQAIEAFENYMDENYTRDENGAPYGIDTYYYYAEEYSDYYTCTYRVKGYLGAQAYLNKYFFMDLTTGSVYTIEYEDSTFSAATDAPGIRIIGSVFEVFNGLDYIG